MFVVIVCLLLFCCCCFFVFFFFVCLLLGFFRGRFLLGVFFGVGDSVDLRKIRFILKAMDDAIKYTRQRALVAVLDRPC